MKPTTIYVPVITPIPTIPEELKKPCPDVKEITSSRPDGVSQWIITEIDQHSKCIIRSKATSEYLKVLEEYGNQSN